MRWEVRTMRYGTSFCNLTVCRKHLSRFWPLWVAWLLVVLLLLPGQALVLLQMDAGQQGGQYLANFAQNVPRDLCNSSVVLALSLLVGLLAAMAGCSHLYNSRSANFMGALPLRREGLFLSHYLSGLTMVLIPPVLAFLLTLLIELAGDALALQVLGYWLWDTCATGFFFYTFAVFLGMFTGHLLALPAFYAIFNLLPLSVTALLNWVLQEFYYGFAALPDWVNTLSRWLTPAWNLSTMRVTWSTQESEPMMTGGQILWAYTGVAVVLAAAALLLYRRRQLETAGDVVAVRVMRPVFRYGVAFCAALFLGQVTAALIGQSRNHMVLMVCVFLWGIAGCFAAQMLLDKSFRVLRRWKGAAAVGAVLLLAFAVVELDLTGFETRVPRAEEVATVQVRGLNGFPQDSGSYADAWLDSPESVARVTALHQAIVDSWERGEMGEYESVTLTYKLKDGTTLTRQYRNQFLSEEVRDRVQLVLEDPQLIWQSYSLAEMEEAGGPRSVTWTVENQQGMESGAQAQALLAAVKEDIFAGRLGAHRLAEESSDVPAVTLSFEWRVYPNGTGVESSYYRESSIDVPATALSTLAVLEELGQGG